MTIFTAGPLLPRPVSRPTGGGEESGGGGGESAPAAPQPKGIYVGVIQDGDAVEIRRAYARFAISDLPGAVLAARLEWQYVDRAGPTGDVDLLEINDFGTLDAAAWGIATRATILASAITPATATGTKLTFDCTTRYNQAKVDGLSVFAVELRYTLESEGLGAGRWYQVGASGDYAPTLVLTMESGQDCAINLLATALVVNTADVDGQGTPIATVTAGLGESYPPLGADVRLAATINGIQDTAAGLYSGTGSGVLERFSDLVRFLWLSNDEGSGLDPSLLDYASVYAASLLLLDWFPFAGGLTQRQDVRAWIATLCQSARAFAYLDQYGREAIWVEPLTSVVTAPVRLITPHEHGALTLFPIQATTGAVYPISRVEVFYGWDYLGIAGWQGHARISAEETDPPDRIRQRQAVAAVARYGLRDLGGIGDEASAENSYAWIPPESPGVRTGTRLRDWLWDRGQFHLAPVQGLTVALPRFALGFRLMDVFTLESAHFPSAYARKELTATPVLGTTEPSPLAYQARRARCIVRELPRLLPEAGADFPVLVTAQLVGWETP